MTREINFLTSFSSQLATYSGWSFITRNGKRKLPPSDFPSFAFELGATSYTRFAFNGPATSGEQLFRLTIFFRQPQLKPLDAFASHSDDVNIAEQFVNAVYAPPAISPGETYRIEGAEIISVKPAEIDPLETRFAVKIEGKYFFTLF
jgi:hypothetical protein